MLSKENKVQQIVFELFLLSDFQKEKNDNRVSPGGIPLRAASPNRKLRRLAGVEPLPEKNIPIVFPRVGRG
jgi:hypothetical protein